MPKTYSYDWNELHDREPSTLIVFMENTFCLFWILKNDRSICDFANENPSEVP